MDNLVVVPINNFYQLILKGKICRTGFRSYNLQSVDSRFYYVDFILYPTRPMERKSIKRILYEALAFALKHQRLERVKY